MASKNTEDAIDAFKQVLKAENNLACTNKALSAAVRLVPDSEKAYYVQETELLRNIWDGSFDEQEYYGVKKDGT